ncbi:hypothetical protein Dimus_008743 [Dionaea muscipula]
MRSNYLVIVSSSFLVFTIILLSVSVDAAVFNVKNNCGYTIWVGAVPGGGQQLNPGQTWTFNVNPGTAGARIWPRTGCNPGSNGELHCNTGDCGGRFQCQGYGQPPNTLAEYALNQFDNLDFFDISLVDGFNVPLAFLPTSNGCTRGPVCSADLISGCPGPLRALGGCNNPCTVFKTDQYCCNSGSCGPTEVGSAHDFRARVAN